MIIAIIAMDYEICFVNIGKSFYRQFHFASLIKSKAE